MRSPSKRTSQAALAACVLVFVGFLLPLLAALPQVTFLPGRTLETFTVRQADRSPSKGTNLAVVDLVIKILLTLLLIAVAALMYRLYSRTVWRVTLVVLMLAAAAMLLLSSLSDAPDDGPISPQIAAPLESTMSESPAGSEGADAPAPVVPAPVRVRAMDTVLAVLIGFIVAGTTMLFLLRLRRRHEVDQPPATIMDNVTHAANRILAGEDVYTVVLRCYRDMMTTLSVRLQVDPTCLTPREFARRLLESGLSEHHVDELTVLFETVRYGDQVDASFAPRAVKCLQSIQEAHADQTA